MKSAPPPPATPFERSKVEVTLSALTSASSCLVCEAEGTCPVPVRFARGVTARDLDDYLTTLPLCRVCAERDRAVDHAGRARFAVALVAPALTGVTTAMLAPPSPVWSVGAFAGGVALGQWLLRTVRRQRASLVPAVVVAARKRVVTVVVASPRTAPSTGAAPYREASTPQRAAPPSPPALKDIMGLLAGFAAAVGAFATFSAWTDANPVVLFDNPDTRSSAVRIDGAPLRRVGGLRDFRERLHAGSHRVEVLREGAAPEITTVELPRGSDHVFVIPGEGCYQAPDHTGGTSGWDFSFLSRYSRQQIRLGRWLAVKEYEGLNRVDCLPPAPPWPPNLPGARFLLQ
jgi:hypothetical protein